MVIDTSATASPMVRAYGEPLLFKGTDFDRTDLTPGIALP